MVKRIRERLNTDRPRLSDSRPHASARRLSVFAPALKRRAGAINALVTLSVCGADVDGVHRICCTPLLDGMAFSSSPLLSMNTNPVPSVFGRMTAMV